MTEETSPCHASFVTLYILRQDKYNILKWLHILNPKIVRNGKTMVQRENCLDTGSYRIFVSRAVRFFQYAAGVVQEGQEGVFPGLAGDSVLPDGVARYCKERAEYLPSPVRLTE